MANGTKPRTETRNSPKFFGTCSETTSSVRARPKITSLNTSRREITVPRRRNPFSMRSSWCERGIVASQFLLDLTDCYVSRPRLSGGAGFQIQDRRDELAQRHSHMAPQAFLQAGVVLRAAENISHQLAEDGT